MIAEMGKCERRRDLVQRVKETISMVHLINLENVNSFILHVKTIIWLIDFYHFRPLQFESEALHYRDAYFHKIDDRDMLR